MGQWNTVCTRAGSGGIFVFRAGDFLGFFHRTFQEYFAARHLLNLLAADPARMQTEMLTLARRRDALWREPYLLALTEALTCGVPEIEEAVQARMHELPSSKPTI